MRAFYLLFTLLITLPAQAELMMEGAYVRLPPPNARTAAAYGTLVNNGSTDIKVTDVRSERFGGAMLHSTVIEDGVSKMRHLHGVELEPGDRMPFAPGGAHIMLMRPTAPLAEGETVVIELEAGGQWHRFELPVVRK